jgi:hypothetical protein
MIMKQLILGGCAAIILSIATAQAGPCNTGGKSAQDAGAGPTPGNTGQTVGTTGSANAEHPPTSAMNRVTGDAAASSQDAQKTDARPAYGSSARPRRSTVSEDGRSRLLNARYRWRKPAAAFVIRMNRDVKRDLARLRRSRSLVTAVRLDAWW